MKIFPSGTIRGVSIKAMPSRQVAAIYQHFVNKGYSLNKKYVSKRDKANPYSSFTVRKKNYVNIPGQFCLFDESYNPLI